MSKTFEDALEGLPTMSQFAKREQCEEARLKHMWAAGREQGHREGVEEAVGIAKAVEGRPLCMCFSWRVECSDIKSISDNILAALPSPVGETALNQCDGCNSNMPVENGIHQNGSANHMCCTADRYGKATAETAVCEWTRPKGFVGAHNTGCGEILDYEDEFRFCPFCGKSISVVAA